MARVDEEMDPVEKKKKAVTSSFLTKFPERIQQLVRLKTLTMSECGLKEIPDSVFQYLVHLEQLNLPLNMLTSLPEKIGMLKNLIRLSVHSNNIRELPESVLLLTKLDTLLIYNNEMTKVPMSLAIALKNLKDFKSLNQKTGIIQAEGTDFKAMAGREEKAVANKEPSTEFLNWLKAVATGGTVKINRCKLMFVGDGNVGKTTTSTSLPSSLITVLIWFSNFGYLRNAVSALMRAAAAKAKSKGKLKARTDATGRDLDNVATDGIDIRKIEVSAGVKHSNGTMGASDNIVFSCWDFAGQDVYYHTHQFFISDRSIYLVGFNMEVEDEAQALARVEYWLQSVNARLPGAPIVVFGTHAASKKCTKDYIKSWEKRLTAKYKKRVRTNLLSVSLLFCRL
jgi:GTPase SAR1 family protein